MELPVLPVTPTMDCWSRSWIISTNYPIIANVERQITWDVFSGVALLLMEVGLTVYWMENNSFSSVNSSTD